MMSSSVYGNWVSDISDVTYSVGSEEGEGVGFIKRWAGVRLACNMSYWDAAKDVLIGRVWGVLVGAPQLPGDAPGSFQSTHIC